jgi:hypothetical protein
MREMSKDAGLIGTAVTNREKQPHALMNEV